MNIRETITQISNNPTLSKSEMIESINQITEYVQNHDNTVDGGFANSVYKATELFDGGGA